MSKFEQVVTIRLSSVADKLQEGFTPIVGTDEEKEAQFDEFFKSEEIVVGSRHWLEQDENFLQIIPCCVFRKPDGSVLNYQRIKGSGEGRLLSNYSVNIGGHAGMQDLYFTNSIGTDIDVAATIWACILREVAEELGCDLDKICMDKFNDNLDEFKGIIYDSSNAVGRVHIGLLFVFDVEQECEFNAEVAESEGMLLQGWYPPNVILKHDDYGAINLENWAKIVLEAL